MSTLLLTLALTFVVVLIAISLLGISWLLTGKSKMQPGACGRDPTKKRKDECGSNVSCQLCDHPEKKESPSDQESEKL